MLISFSKKIIILSFLITPFAHAEEKVFECWDGSYAKTQVFISKTDEQLIKFNVQSLKQSLFADLIQEEASMWGYAAVNASAPLKDCVIEPNSRFTCASTGNVTLEFYVNSMVHVMRTIPALKFFFEVRVDDAQEVSLDFAFTPLLSDETGRQYVGNTRYFNRYFGKCRPKM